MLRQAAHQNRTIAGADHQPGGIDLVNADKLPKIGRSAAFAHEPHRIAFYLVDLAGAFHSLWNAGRDNPALRFHIAGQDDLTNARLQLVSQVSLSALA